ncbi:YggS family pyridoxal phosphate-dependent enzyme [Macrococcus hajekii]|uniref:Pyridoxal phosphate homeostasis protein n=1 Tax=Macrococcus hajekii TaxID=198482 RepID=A0A4V3BE98_9STAP|nr:YggS family pyridoxal phosphate-dependent enzyme [Macrococcus hajekii]TDM03275.1 YggS family pyridoxal phosphate-dependent enzyme [Macrococcus hajekii]GGA97515.1 YggS family pyridoxal phosphate enzyme [Macrococcus hajekii]
MQVQDNLNQIYTEIDSVTHDRPTIIAVTKYVTIDRAQEAFDAGLTHFGENRIEGFLEKKAALSQAVFHFIGSLQTRKVKEVINEIDYLHSLDRQSLADEIQKRAEQPVKCFVQVNIAAEESKHGLAKEEVIDFVQGLASYDKIEIVGLMTMAPHIDDQQQLRGYFSELRMLQQQIAGLQQHNAPCTELSMGMSNDYLSAIQEGSTFIRIGTKLVG